VLTPEEIRAREFLVSLRGYDRGEVQAFLGDVADQVRQLQERLAHLESAGGGERAESGDLPSRFADLGRETQRILDTAQEAGDALRRQAKQEADRQLQEARAHTARLVAEGERRRDAIERVVAGLEEARAGLADDLRGMGRTIEQALRDFAPEREPTASVREALEAAAAADLAAEGESEPADDAARPDALPGVSTDAPREGAGDADGPASAVPPTGGPAHHAPGGAPGSGPAAGARAEGLATAGDAGPPGGAPAWQARAVATGPATDELPVVPPEASEAHRLRNPALDSLHPRLVRTLKRGLGDLQTVALDRLRRAEGQGEVDSFLPADDEFLALAASARKALGSAYRKGTAAASSLAGLELPPVKFSPTLHEALCADVADRVRAALGESLGAGLSADEPVDALRDRAGSAFLELENNAADEWSMTHLLHAYEQGLLDAWAAGGVSRRRWVVGAEPDCPDGRCRENGQAGDVPVGDPFPSGHDTPPVHAGCSCTTVPTGEPST
jgi:DivIVA domain-containing protein